jgi:single-stranded-DNA-specific exonuclease
MSSPLELSLTGKRWLVTTPDPEAAGRLSAELGVSASTAEVLIQRGYASPEDASKFLNPSLDDLSDAFLLPDFDAARDEILGAKERGELIYVHGDYDVDGVTSAAIFDRYLKKIGCNVHTHVPHRINEGYGINLSAVDAAHDRGAKLFLTCDCGITAHAQVLKARELGMRVVVTDHHELKETLPEAQAVVNPHRKDSRYPFSHLSGAGVVYRLCEGLTRSIDEKGVDSYRKNFVDLAALGTIADVMPLSSDNRIIARFGLEKLTDTKKKGLVALKEVSDIRGKVMSYDVGFKLGPRLNAAGRIDDAALSLRLLLTEDATEAREVALELDKHNLDRRAMQDLMFEEAFAQAEAQGGKEQHMIMVFNPEWHPGIVGLLAGKLKEHYARPVFAGTIDPETGKGKASGRSIPGLSLAELISAHPALVQGGGHAMAAGIGFPEAHLEEIRAAFNSYALSTLSPEDLFPAIEIATFVDPAKVDRSSIDEFSALEPFGMMNPKPIFGAQNLEVLYIKSMGQERQHIALTLKHAGGTVRCVGWGMFAAMSELRSGDRVDVAFEPQLNTYQGQESLQWKLADVRRAV